MYCEKCGEKLEDGAVYCSKCGQAVTVVPEYSLIDDYIELNISEEGGKSNIAKHLLDEEGNIRKDISANDEESVPEEEGMDPETRRKLGSKMMLFIALAVVIVIALAVFIVTVVRSSNAKSIDYQLKTAKEAMEKNDDDKALEALFSAIDIEPDNVEALSLLGDEYFALKDYDKAISYYEKVYKKNPDVCENLIIAYKETDNYSGISAALQAADNEELYESFEQYALYEPEISEDPGHAGGKTFIKIEAEGDNKIYYSIDGSDPYTEGKLYTDPVEIEAGNITVKACSVNDYGVTSKVVNKDFNIEYKKPDAPTVSPGSGTFGPDTDIVISGKPGETYYYTWDGSDPTTSSEEYTGTLKMIKGNNVLSVIAVNDAGTSEVTRVNYICK